MNRYRLTPINLDDTCWAQYRDQDKQPIEVEAEDEEEARLKALGESGAMQEGQSKNPVDPWGDPEKTLCEYLGEVTPD